jgi:hypothetical protein
MKIKLNGKPRETVNIRIYLPDKELSGVRFWCNNENLKFHWADSINFVIWDLSVVLI